MVEAEVLIATVAAAAAPSFSKWKKSLENAPPRPPPGVAFGFRLSHRKLDAKAEELYGKPTSVAQQIDNCIQVVYYLWYRCPRPGWPMSHEYVWWKGDFYSCLGFVKLPPPDEIIDQTKDMLVREGVIEERRVPKWYKVAIS